MKRKAPSFKPTGSKPLAPALRARLQQLYEAEGEHAVIDRVRISRNALYRCLAGLGVYRGTHALVREALDGDVVVEGGEHGR